MTTMPGRIETYVHSDSTTPNKGGCLVEVSCVTDFAAKSPEFVQFCKNLARFCYGFHVFTWQQLEGYPVDTPIREEYRRVVASLGDSERIYLRRVVRMELGE
jgi:translation elongation factor EF-Ts